VRIEFSPEPTPEEAEALLRALSAPDDRGEVDAWWQEGLREAVEQEPDDAAA
jgi:hypothetical protein